MSIDKGRVSLSSARGLLERATHRVQFTRSMPEPFGDLRLRVSTEGGLRLLKARTRAFDPMLLRVAKDYVQLGDVIWDVGANLGIFSFASGKMAGVGGEVVALEPDPELVGLLRASVQLNSDARLAEIRICDCAASASTGFGDLVVASRSRATNHLKGFGTTQTGGERYLERVRTIKLDDLLEDHRSPDVIKIDVEGAEWDVLRGAESSLGNARVVIVEVAGGKGREIHEMLGDLGFQLYDATDPQRGPQDRAVSDSLFLRPSQ